MINWLPSSAHKTIDMAKSSKKEAATVPFKQNSKEFKALIKLSKTGEVKPTDQPASVRSKCVDLFGKCTTTQFRSQCGKAKGLAGVNGTS